MKIYNDDAILVKVEDWLFLFGVLPKIFAALAPPVPRSDRAIVLPRWSWRVVVAAFGTGVVLGAVVIFLWLLYCE